MYGSLTRTVRVLDVDKDRQTDFIYTFQLYSKLLEYNR